MAQANFFVKTHYPALGRTDAHYWDRFDKIVTVVRNPLDAVASYLQFRHVPRNFSSTAHDAHEAKVLDYFGAELQEEVEFLTNRWLSHARELHDVVKPKHFVRYEDIRDSPVTQVMGMLTFMLPEDERPPLARVACIARQNDHLEAYKSRKSRPFSSWDKWDPEVRQVVLDMTEPCVVRFASRLSHTDTGAAGSATGALTRFWRRSEAPRPCQKASAQTPSSAQHAAFVDTLSLHSLLCTHSLLVKPLRRLNRLQRGPERRLEARALVFTLGLRHQRRDLVWSAVDKDLHRLGSSSTLGRWRSSSRANVVRRRREQGVPELTQKLGRAEVQARSAPHQPVRQRACAQCQVRIDTWTLARRTGLVLTRAARRFRYDARLQVLDSTLDLTVLH